MLNLKYPDFEATFVRDLLINDYKLIEYWGTVNYWIKLTPDGATAAKIGITKYLSDIENDKALEKENLVLNKKGIKTAIFTSRIALFASIIIPILVAFIQVQLEYIINKPDKGINNGNPREQKTNSNLILNKSDSLLIEKVKDSLKHDTVFLNEIKHLINNKKQK